ncbi:hypothetical protein [Ornithinimicrobium murale]|uniref:hypothetical protein n=1 Tax=Ornithinimicrobium murale TaxID=1050153 RepID=UPI000E0DF317|nr:hypothetical protein [Ornithinimicrobium murale]
MSTAVATYDETQHPRGDGGRFTIKPASESDAELGAALAPAPMSDEDHRFLVGEFGRFENGYDDQDIDSVLSSIEGAEMVCVWDSNEDGDFTGDSEIVGRVGDGPWRRIRPELWNHLSGEDGTLGGGTCSDCGGECVVAEDGTSNHLSVSGEVDHDADADHVALDESLVENPLDPAPLLSEGTPLLSDEPYEVQDLDDRYRSGANIAFESDGDDEDVCSCGASLDDGEGYDGMCGNCADRADNDLQYNDEPRDYDEDRAYEALVDAGHDSDLADEVTRKVATFKAAFETAEAGVR